MNLKSLMRESFTREEINNPSFLPRRSFSEVPCKVERSPTWEEDENFVSKVFTFSSRISMHSFCQYIFDLEQQTATKVSLSYTSEKDEVQIKIKKSLIAIQHTKKFFVEIDNIYLDVTASFENG